MNMVFTSFIFLGLLAVVPLVAALIVGLVLLWRSHPGSRPVVLSFLFVAGVIIFVGAVFRLGLGRAPLAIWVWGFAAMLVGGLVAGLVALWRSGRGGRIAVLALGGATVLVMVPATMAVAYLMVRWDAAEVEERLVIPGEAMDDHAADGTPNLAARASTPNGPGVQHMREAPRPGGMRRGSGGRNGVTSRGQGGVDGGEAVFVGWSIWPFALVGVLAALLVWLIVMRRQGKTKKVAVGGSRGATAASRVVSGLTVAGAIVLVILALVLVWPASDDNGVHTARPETSYGRDPYMEAPSVSERVPRSARRLWRDRAGQTFLADVYPSRAAAAEALARYLVFDETDAIDAVGPESLIVYGYAEQSVLRAAARPFSDHGSIGDIAIQPGLLEGQGHSRRRLALGIETTVDESSLGSAEESGSVTATLQAGDQTASADVRFVQKPWADRFSEFAAEHPDNSYIRVVSSEAATDQNEARRQAIEQAVDRLYPQISVRESAGWHRDRNVRQRRADVEHAIRKHLPDHIADQFVQRFERPYGDVWQWSLLVDASPEELIELSANVNADIRSLVAADRTRRASIVSTILSSAGLVAVVFLLYLLLNLATRGYYARSLRAVAVVLVAVGLATLLLLTA